MVDRRWNNSPEIVPAQHLDHENADIEAEGDEQHGNDGGEVGGELQLPGLADIAAVVWFYHVRHDVQGCRSERVVHGRPDIDEGGS